MSVLSARQPTRPSSRRAGRMSWVASGLSGAVWDAKWQEMLAFAALRRAGSSSEAAQRPRLATCWQHMDTYRIPYNIYILHQHRPQTVGYTLGHILCLFSLNATDLRCLCGFIWFLSPNGDDIPVWFQSAPAPGLDHDYGQITTSVVLLGVQVANVRRGYLGGRRCRRRDLPAPAPAPGLHHDYGQITTSVVLLGVQVPRRRRPDYIMSVARSRPDHVLP